MLPAISYLEILPIFEWWNAVLMPLIATAKTGMNDKVIQINSAVLAGFLYCGEPRKNITQQNQTISRATEISGYAKGYFPVVVCQAQ